MSIHVIQDDITTLQVDAIVNAANPSLLGGGGVDGAIHRAAGDQLLEACRDLPERSDGTRCPVGEARITPGFDLPARHVIHTVGPVWHGGDAHEAEQLAACYRNSLQLADDHDLRSIAFPAISCGVYGYPPDKAARVAVRSVRRWLDAHDDRIEVKLCCFDEDMTHHVQQALQQSDSDRAG